MKYSQRILGNNVLKHFLDDFIKHPMGKFSKMFLESWLNFWRDADAMEFVTKNSGGICRLSSEHNPATISGSFSDVISEKKNRQGFSIVLHGGSTILRKSTKGFLKESNKIFLKEFLEKIWKRSCWRNFWKKTGRNCWSNKFKIFLKIISWNFGENMRFSKEWRNLWQNY